MASEEERAEADRDNLVYLARLAKDADLHEDLLDAMKKVARFNEGMGIEERELFDAGYKNLFEARAKSWSILSLDEKEAEASGDIGTLTTVKECKKIVESKLSDFCNDTLTVIDEHLMRKYMDSDESVFYYKMKGDSYHRLSDFLSGNEKKEAVDRSMEAYQTAYDIADVQLPPNHPVRLDVALNFSVFCYRTMNCHERAYQIVSQAFHDVIPELDTINDEYEESYPIFKSLGDNLVRWAYDISKDAADKYIKDYLSKAARKRQRVDEGQDSTGKDDAK